MESSDRRNSLSFSRNGVHSNQPDAALTSRPRLMMVARLIQAISPNCASILVNSRQSGCAAGG
jgi:hypothetical protein